MEKEYKCYVGVDGTYQFTKYMHYEFSKSEKKIFRQVIDTGLQRDYQSCIFDIDNIIQQWKSKKLDNRNAYQEIYQKVKENDRIIWLKKLKYPGSQQKK